MNYRSLLIRYLAADTLTAWLAWAVFQKGYHGGWLVQLPVDWRLLGEQVGFGWSYLALGAFWIFLYWLSGYYNKEALLFKSRLSEFLQSVASCFVGALLLFFFYMIDQPASLYEDYSHAFALFFYIQFLLTYLVRLAITNSMVGKIRRRKVGWNTLVIGVGARAAKLGYDLDHAHKSLGYNVLGYVAIPKREGQKVDEGSIVGTTDRLDELIDRLGIAVVFLAVDGITEMEIYKFLHLLSVKNVKIKLIPNKYQLVTGSVHMDTIYGIPMIDLTTVRMSEFQKNLKRLLDVIVSLVTLTVLLPVFLIMIALIGRKPIYRQERAGRYGNPFVMYKFRSMKIDAEANGPQLTEEDDERVTRFGRFMRKYRLDELPQFWNVLIGDMSLVGPRPERIFYVNQIVQEVPYYYMLSNVRPGITSWGMVKYGYANTIEGMIERADYDVIYLENMSLVVDCKILIYTVRTVLTGEGL